MELLIQRLRSEGCPHCDLLLYEAICVYERQQDIECLRLLADFLREVPRHGKRHYAIFTAAVCLMNVGLESRARALLQKVPDTYPGRDKELKDLSVVLARRKKAAVHANAIRSLLEES